VLNSIKENWYKVVPESARAPVKKSGKVSIKFGIRSDGQLGTRLFEMSPAPGMKIVESSGDASLDQAAWNAIAASNPFSPLPPEFSGRYVSLLVHFYYNSEPAEPVDTPEQLALRLKCSPYSGTTLEDLEKKQAPLPPHECAGVLGWMRDERVESLYAPEKPTK
jgi:TonB family protein